MFHRFRTYPSQPDLPRSFGWKQTWVGVKNASLETILTTFGLRQVKPANWEAGMARCDVRFPGRLVFISPSLDGWTLILNLSVFRGPRTREHLEQTSAGLGSEVVCFGNFPSVGMVLWAYADGGQVRRIYLRSDGVTVFHEGIPLAQELDLDLVYDVSSDADDFQEDALPTAETVFHLAQALSVNPLRIQEQFREPSAGWIAKRSD